VSSDIAQIIDYTAVVAAGIAGVRQVYGAGQGLYADPLRAGQMIAAAPDRVQAPFTHTSELPDAPTVDFLTQTGTIEVVWQVPMRLYVNRSRLEDVRRALLPFYDRYLGAFARDRQLGGLCSLAWISSFRVEADDDWAWLAADLSVREYVSY
jgi:hypothetical protein